MTLDAELVEALVADYDNAPLTPAERAMLDFASQLTRDATRITPGHHERLRAHGFDDRAILQITLIAAWFNYPYFTYGGELWKDGKLFVDQEACVKALGVWDTMNKEGLFEPDVTAGTFTDQVATMTSGTAGMTITGPWVIGMYAAQGPDTKFGTFPVPQGTNPATVGVTDVYAMFKDSKNPAAAKAFVEFLMDPARDLEFIQGRGFLPVYTEHFALPEFQAEPLKAFVDALPTAKFVPLDPNWVEFDKIGTNAVTTMFLDGTGPEVACQAIVDGLAGLEQ